MTWNHEIDTAPRGHTVKSTRTIKGKFQEITDFEPDHVWLATKCGKVLKSYWIPEAGKVAARWSGLATGEHPVAWQPFVVPAHPFASNERGKPEAQSPVLADRANAGGGHVTDGENAQPASAGEFVNSSPDILIVHKHIFLDDCGSGA